MSEDGANWVQEALKRAEAPEPTTDQLENIQVGQSAAIVQRATDDIIDSIQKDLITVAILSCLSGKMDEKQALLAWTELAALQRFRDTIKTRVNQGARARSAIMGR